MTESSGPVPRPQPEPEKGSIESATSGRSTAPGARPKYTREDFKTVAAKIRYDLTAAQAKLTELMTMLASVEIPDDPHEFNEDRFLTFIRNTAHVYTDESLLDEARLQGAPPELDERILEIAAGVREHNTPRPVS